MSEYPDWYSQLQLGKKPLTNKRLDEVARQIKGIYDKILANEQAGSREFYATNAAESLTTDTHGKRTRSWFDETGLSFATGVPSTCFVVAIVHDDIGMAAAHTNTIRLNFVKPWLQRASHDPKVSHFMTTASDVDVRRSMINAQNLKTVIGISMDQALNDFAQITPNGVPQSGTKLLFGGIDYIAEEQKGDITSFAISRLQRHPAFNDGIYKGSGRDVSIRESLGVSEGVIYGGPNHRSYRTPSLYTI